jgi:hypothetical protein
MPMTEGNAWLSRICGSEITGFLVEEHLGVGSTARTLISVWMATTDTGFGLRTAAAGWGLAVETAPPTSYDMEESGRVEVHADAGAYRLVRGRIKDVWLVHSALAPEQPVGVRWDLEDGGGALAISYDDNLLVNEDLPEHLETISYSRLCP